MIMSDYVPFFISHGYEDFMKHLASKLFELYSETERSFPRMDYSCLLGMKHQLCVKKVIKLLGLVLDIWLLASFISILLLKVADSGIFTGL